MKNVFLTICLLAALTTASASQSPEKTKAAGGQSAAQERMRETLRQTQATPRPALDLAAAKQQAKDGFTCGRGACYCEGVLACIDMIEANVCPSATKFHCGGGNPPACVCER